MPQPATLAALLDAIRESGLIPTEKLESFLTSNQLPARPDQALETLVRLGLLTSFHARHLSGGKSKGFLLGSYRVLRPLGKGGMGLVYLAEHVSLNRQVAIKILRKAMLDEKGARERFFREGRATAALDHPNIVRLHDVGREGDMHYMVMEYVEGKSLDSIIRQQGRLPLPQAVDYIIQAARGLQHAHEKGIVHRDIKPANLLIDGRGVVKILDMGLARFYEDRTDNLTERVGGGILGSPDYIAPEQARHQLDTRSDIYSLGATLYMLLVGQPPFPGSTVAQKLIAHQTKPVIPPHRRDPAIPADLSVFVARMLAKDPAERPQTPGEVVDALTSFMTAPSPTEEPGEKVSPVAPTSGMRWFLIAGGVVLGGACLGVIIWWLSRLLVVPS